MKPRERTIRIQYEEKKMPNCYDRLQKIEPKIGGVKDVLELVDSLYESSAFNGRRVAEACHLYEKMISSDTTICLTMAGAVTTAGLGGIICSAIEKGLIDFIISTGANLYHDLHFALNLPVYRGDFRIDDRELLNERLVRIYDVFIPFDTLLKTDCFIRETFKDLSFKTSTAEIHHHLGKRLIERGVEANRSILSMAAIHQIPVYTPSPADSSIGMNLARLKLSDGKLVVDTDLDVLETAAIIYDSQLNGAVMLGGGAPKNFYMQTQPALSQILDIDKGGHDFFIQICTDPDHYGGLSGATHNEAVSWGKINPNKVENGVTVYCDFTVATPILLGYVLEKKLSRKHKHLYTRRKKFVAKLREATG